ncbi:class I SAM-dependent methyltransferase [Lutimaribacter marinistellae]|uniref:Class I SAM-dependent methyltransferase n=1 Tax=Lutimaribacter marinistellae TaxID=1820329 RepID=A0ABV7TE24_9RHOB
MGRGAEEIISLYRRHAQAWAARRGTAQPERIWLDRFLDILPETPGVLDLGCGSGVPIARYLCGRGCAVTGIDSSPELIGMARRSVPEASFVVADMRELQLGDRFDGILAWDSFFHLTREDQRRMFATFARHAGPGAALMFTSGPENGEAIGSFEGEPLYHASLGPEEYRALLRDHGFETVAHVVEDPDCGGHTIWLAQRR